MTTKLEAKIAPAILAARAEFVRGWNAYLANPHYSACPDWSEEYARKGFHACEARYANVVDAGPEVAEAAAAEAIVAPAVGMGASFTLWTDSYACTVVEVRKGGREVLMQRDKATLLNGFDSGADDALTFTPGGFCGHTEGNQRYTFERDTKGDTFVVSIRALRNGDYTWKRVGQKTSERGGVARFGKRAEHYDYNF